MAGNSYKMADAAELMAALQVFLLLLVIAEGGKHMFWVREIFERSEQFRLRNESLKLKKRQSKWFYCFSRSFYGR